MKTRTVRAAALAALPLAAVLAVSAATGAALAQPAARNVVGIYTGDFSGPTLAHFEGTGEVTLSVVLSNLSYVPWGLAGWALRIVQEGAGATLLNVDLPGPEPMNISLPPDFCVGYGTFMPPDERGDFTVARLTYTVATTEPTRLSITYNPACMGFFEPGPVYAHGDDAGEPISLVPSSGSMDAPVFGFNTGPLAIPVQGRTWGAVKGLYR